MRYRVAIQARYEMAPRLELEVEADSRHEAKLKVAAIYSESTNDGNKFHYFSPEHAYRLVRRATLLNEVNHA